MSLMSKLLISTLVATVTLSANADNTVGKVAQTVVKKSKISNKLLLQYLKKNIIKNPQVSINDVNVVETKTDKNMPGWDLVMVNMDLTYQKKNLHVPEMMFIKDGMITSHLVNLETGEDYRESIKPTVPMALYNDEHLLFGDKDATHKILIFSDPQCPFCQDIIPKIFTAAKKNPKKIALYYYHLPLVAIHPVSDTLTKIMHLAQVEGKLDVVEKIYSLKINPREIDMTKILAAVKAHSGYSVSADKVNDKKLKKLLELDAMKAADMMVTGTPTIYIDGVWDKDRNGYKKLIK